MMVNLILLGDEPQPSALLVPMPDKWAGSIRKGIKCVPNQICRSLENKGAAKLAPNFNIKLKKQFKRFSTK